MGTNPSKVTEFVVKKWTKFPTKQATDRMDAGLNIKIVIPVVVGSSPISHPK
jgi:hypothetical protein